jgi:hypothetical protein
MKGAVMSQADFDPELEWDGQDWFEPRMDEPYELFGPDMLEAADEEAEDSERGVIDRHPGVEDVGKSTDPDEWHH